MPLNILLCSVIFSSRPEPVARLEPLRAGVTTYQVRTPKVSRPGVTTYLVTRKNINA